MTTGQYPKQRETKEQAKARVEAIQERNDRNFYNDREVYDSKHYVRKVDRDRDR